MEEKEEKDEEEEGEEEEEEEEKISFVRRKRRLGKKNMFAYKRGREGEGKFCSLTVNCSLPFFLHLMTVSPLAVLRGEVTSEKEEEEEDSYSSAARRRRRRRRRTGQKGKGLSRFECSFSSVGFRRLFWGGGRGEGGEQSGRSCPRKDHENFMFRDRRPSCKKKKSTTNKNRSSPLPTRLIWERRERECKTLR